MMIKYKVSDVANNFNVPAKEIIAILAEHNIAGKKSATALEEHELNVIFEHYTQKHNTDNLDTYFATAIDKPKAEPVKEEPAATVTAAAAQKPQQNKVTGVTNVNDFLRIRSGPGTSYSVAGYLKPKQKVEILEQKDKISAAYKKDGSRSMVPHTNKAGALNMVQNPMLKQILDLKKLALPYWRDLGLTPAGMKKLHEDALKGKKKSALGEALKNLGG